MLVKNSRISEISELFDAPNEMKLGVNHVYMM